VPCRLRTGASTGWLAPLCAMWKTRYPSRSLAARRVCVPGMDPSTRGRPVHCASPPGAVCAGRAPPGQR